MQRVRRLGILSALWAAIAWGNPSTVGSSRDRMRTPEASLVKASFITSLGRQLDPDFPGSSLSFEPTVSYASTGGPFLRFRALLDRPLDAHKTLRAPFVEALGILLLAKSERWDAGGVVQTSAQDIHEWSTEGIQVRQFAGVFARWRALPRLTAELSAGPFFSVCEYEKRRNGDPFSKAGALEQLSLAYQWGPLKLELLALIVQDWNGRWRNLYSTFERVSYNMAAGLSVGVTHQLFRSHVDESTGSLQPIGVFDGRRSRIAGFIQWQI